jgi:hypothetical protein
MKENYFFMISELKKLFTEKEYRIYLILVLWLLIGYTFFSFPAIFPRELSYLIFPPLLGVTTVLFIVSIIEREELGKLSRKKFLVYGIIGIIVAIVFHGIWRLFVGFLYRAGILSYILITSIFYMYGCYKYGIKADDKVYGLSRPVNQIIRWIMFLGGTGIAVLITFFLSRIGGSWAAKDPEINDVLGRIALFMLILIIILAVIGVLTLVLGYLNAWLGIFLIFVSFFTAYLMINAFYTLTVASDDTPQKLLTHVGLYIFDVGLIFYTVSTILGEKSEIISRKLKVIKVDTVILWLVFSKAAFELAAVADPRIKAEILNAVLEFILFIPLLIIAGLYGFWKYNIIKKERKTKKENSVAQKPEL